MESNCVEFNLSYKNIIELPFEYEQDFTFIVNGHEYKTSPIVADILSPTFIRALLVDSTIDKFYINTKDQQPIDAESFTDFLKLVNFQQIKLESTKIQAYIKIYKLLLLNCLYKTLNFKRI